MVEVSTAFLLYMTYVLIGVVAFILVDKDKRIHCWYKNKSSLALTFAVMTFWPLFVILRLRQPVSEKHTKALMSLEQGHYQPAQQNQE